MPKVKVGLGHHLLDIGDECQMAHSGLADLSPCFAPDCQTAVRAVNRFGNYESDNSIPPPATNSKPAQPITEGRSPRKAKPIKATTNRLNLSTGTTNEASPCFRALKKQNDDKPLARPESTINSQVCWDNANGLVNFPVARMSKGRKIAMTTVRIRVARSASTLSSPILPNTADALAKSADKKAQINQSGRVGIGLIEDKVIGSSSGNLKGCLLIAALRATQFLSFLFVQY